MYTGVTNNLIRRIYEHKKHYGSTFTKKYKITKLVYYEIFGDINLAITREKQIKGGSRENKIRLIIKNNTLFRDLYDEIAK